MHHKATLSTRFEARPSHIECACGVSGDFLTNNDAVEWMERVHFRRLAGIETSEPVLPVPVDPGLEFRFRPAEPPSDASPSSEGGSGAPEPETLGDA